MKIEEEYTKGEPKELTELRIKLMEKKAILLDNEIRDSDAHARQTEIETRELERRYDDFKAGDQFNRVYRFTDAIHEKSVNSCMDTIARWTRLSEEPIEIIFFSPGGEIIQGMALFDFIQGVRQKGIKVITGATGYAASMAGILLQAGDERWVGEQSWILIHRPSTTAIGALYEVEDAVEFTKRLEERLVNILVSRSKLQKEDIEKNWLRKDWWLTSEEALDAGLVDSVSNKQII
jgi:ATP-dependent Clp endopeptidase proteolytic subunit ClpP